MYFGEGTRVGKHGLDYDVVEWLLKGLKHWSHYLATNNLFASMNLFYNLIVHSIWARGTVRCSSKNLPGGLYKKPKSEVKGSVLISMHIHRQIGVVSKQNKKLVMLLSTTAAPWEPSAKVLHHIPGLIGQLIVPSSWMHHQYVEYM